MTGGFGRGELTLVAARPGVGKTSFAMEVTRRLSADAARRIVVFALDITRENFSKRLLSQISGVDLDRTSASSLGELQWEKLREAAAIIGKSSVFIDDTPRLTPAFILERCRNLISQEGRIDLVIVDYLQLLRVDGPKSESREKELADICRSLKHVVKELDCSILLACQLNRDQLQRDGRPTLRALRDMAPLESSADTVLLLHRDGNEMECIVGKARSGSNGLVRLVCNAGEAGLVFGGEAQN